MQEKIQSYNSKFWGLKMIKIINLICHIISFISGFLIARSILLWPYIAKHPFDIITKENLTSNFLEGVFLFLAVAAINYFILEILSYFRKFDK